MTEATFLDDRAQQSLRERELLLATVAGLPDGAQVVELGSADGFTSVLLAQAGRDRGIRVASVDRAPDAERARRYAAHGVEALHGDSAAPERYWRSGRRADFLLVDADHSWFGVRADFEGWLPHLAPGAVVLFHDVSPVCPGEFLYVWERVFRGELAAVRGAGTLLGGTLATAAPARRAPLSADGAALLARLLDADLAAWPAQLRELAAPPRVPRTGVPAGDPALAPAIRAAFGLDAAAGPAAVHVVVEEPPGPVVGALLARGVPRERIAVAGTPFREELATLLLAAGDPRFWQLFPVEVRGAAREWFARVQPETRAALARGGVAGRVRLFDFVDPAGLYAVARAWREPVHSVTIPRVAQECALPATEGGTYSAAPRATWTPR